MNTHRALIETSVPPGLELLAAGPEEYVRQAAGTWVAKHRPTGLDEFEVLLIVEVVEQTTTPPEERAAYEAEHGAPAEEDAPKPMDLVECVSAFLELVMKHPEKEPRLVRDQRANVYTILGFNKAQETLRGILEVHGSHQEVKKLADVRQEGQQRPEKVGDSKMWLVG